MHHRLRLLSLALHVAAIFWLGMMAGFFGTYSANVSLATQGFEGPLYATVQSALNRNVRHTLFFAFFFLPPLWITGALAAAWRSGGSWRFCMLAAGVLYTVGIIFLTREVNLPLNAYTESWDPASLPADWASTRDRWNLANAVRSAASAAAFLLGIVALVLRRR